MSDDVESRARERVGSVLNEKWSLERLLGIGGMAAVYAARHRNGALAAVKILHADLSSNDEIRERFQREGYAANRVDHPGAVRVLDDDVIVSGPDAGVAYLVMELLRGESLHDRLERGPPVSECEFLIIAETVLEVLAAAHARGVVHRDLKPENLFLMSVPSAASLEDEGNASGARIKVLDFGLARLLHGQAITSHGLALGTPSFMSPEQASGKIDEIDGRTDLFALAATGFRLRTGRRIHEGANAVELVTKMANIAAPRIRTVTLDVSEPFARVIDRGLEFRREDRYRSAAAMRDDVVRARRELEALAVTVAGSAFARAAPVAREPTIEVSTRDLDRSARRGEASIRGVAWRGWMAWSASVLSLGLVLTVATEVWLHFRSGSTPLADAQPPATSASASAAPVTSLDAPLVPDAVAPQVTPDSAAISPASSAPASVPPPRLSGPHPAPPAPVAPASMPRRNASPKMGPGTPPKHPPSRPLHPASQAPSAARGSRSPR